MLIAEDSNDIYILSGEQGREQLSPPESLLISVADSGGLSSWHTESLPVSLSGHESWARVGTMEPEDAKSVDSGEGVASAEERSENNSSNSDIVHVEREEAELLEEVGELQESMLSVLGTESELESLREELRREASSAQQPVAEAPESLMSLEEQIVILDTPPGLAATFPPVDIEPKSSSPTVIAELPVNVQQESLSPPSSSVITDAPVYDDDAPKSLTPSSPTIIADAPVDVELECSVHASLPIAATPKVLDPEPEPQSARSIPVPAPVEPQILRTIQEPEAKSEPHPEAVHATPAHDKLPQEPQADVIQAITSQKPPLSAPAQEIPPLEPKIVQKTSALSQVPFDLPSAAAPDQEILPQELQPVHTASIPAQEPPAAPAHTEPVAAPASSEIPVLLYGGAALVAIAALVAYGALAYRKKY